MTPSSAALAVPLSCRDTTPGDCRLLSMRPHVLRIRAVHAFRGPASVYLHHLDDEVLVGATLRSMLHDLARITATQLGESSRLLEHRGSTVELHELDEHDLAPGPAVEVMLCRHEREGDRLRRILRGHRRRGCTARPPRSSLTTAGRSPGTWRSSSTD